MEKHYENKIEAIDVIMSHELNFNLGNIVKYALRCNHKGSKEQDLRKLIDYANYELNNIK